MITLIGIIAGILTTIAFIPQVVKAFNTRQTKDLSLLMYITFFTGILLWLIYGIIIKNVPIIFANSVTIVLVGLIIGMKIKYK